MLIYRLKLVCLRVLKNYLNIQQFAINIKKNIFHNKKYDLDLKINNIKRIIVNYNFDPSISELAKKELKMLKQIKHGI